MLWRPVDVKHLRGLISVIKFTVLLNSSICSFGGNVSFTGHSFRVSTIHCMIRVGAADIVCVFSLC